MTDGDVTAITDDVKTLMKIYENMGSPVFLRSKEKMADLVKPWKIGKLGTPAIEEWLDMAKSTDKTMQEKWGMGFYGVILEK
jgi:hypothetical protein